MKNILARIRGSFGSNPEMFRRHVAPLGILMIIASVLSIMMVKETITIGYLGMAIITIILCGTLSFINYMAGKPYTTCLYAMGVITYITFILYLIFPGYLSIPLYINIGIQFVLLLKSRKEK